MLVHQGNEREGLLIIARARDAAHAAHLYRTGASDAVPETIEASLQLSVGAAAGTAASAGCGACAHKLLHPPAGSHGK
jgi:CPA2 family monovalent cation:H+ antiporter-2